MSNFQGLRGIGSIFIMTGHMTRGLFPHYVSSADSYGATPHLLQRPILRLFSAGRFWVAVFFLLSGYVCAVKPLRLANAGKAEEAKNTIASSTFRRFLRIGLPATLGTILGWVCCQLGAAELFSKTEVQCKWTTFVVPSRRAGMIASVKYLIRQCVCGKLRKRLIVGQYMEDA
jgi:peptidoglycan/LPS O-acetylase OafA/YrhL